MSTDTFVLHTFEFDFEDPCVYGVDVVRALLAIDTGIIRDLEYQIGMDATDLVLTAYAESASKAAVYAHEFAELVDAETSHTVTNTRYTGSLHSPGGQHEIVNCSCETQYETRYVVRFASPVEPTTARSLATAGVIGADDVEIDGDQYRVTLIWVHKNSGSMYFREAAAVARSIAAAMQSNVLSLEYVSTAQWVAAE